MCLSPIYFIFHLFFFFFNDTATTEIYTLSLHDALPIWRQKIAGVGQAVGTDRPQFWQDRKSTRLNSSHVRISYAVFCLKKKKKHKDARYKKNKKKKRKKKQKTEQEA